MTSPEPNQFLVCSAYSRRGELGALQREQRRAPENPPILDGGGGVRGLEEPRKRGKCSNKWSIVGRSRPSRVCVEIE